MVKKKTWLGNKTVSIIQPIVQVTGEEAICSKLVVVYAKK